MAGPADRYRDPSTWRLRTTGGIPYKLVSRSGLFHAIDKPGANEHFATEVYLIEASRLADFVLEFYPPPRRFGNQLTYLTKQMFGLPLFADEINWKEHIPGLPSDPFGADPVGLLDGRTYQPVLEVAITYRARMRSGDDTLNFVELAANATGEYINIGPAKGACNVDITTSPGLAAGTTLKDAVVPVTRVIPMTDWNIRIPLIPKNKWETFWLPTLRSLMGHVNSTPFALLFDAAKETILLVGYSYREKFPFVENTPPFVELGIKFLEKRVEETPTELGDSGIRGHNHFFITGKGWCYLRYQGPGGANDLRPIHSRADLNQLFVF